MFTLRICSLCTVQRNREASQNATPGMIKRMLFTFTVDQPQPSTTAPATQINVKKPNMKPSPKFRENVNKHGNTLINYVHCPYIPLPTTSTVSAALHHLLRHRTPLLLHSCCVSWPGRYHQLVAEWANQKEIKSTVKEDKVWPCWGDGCTARSCYATDLWHVRGGVVVEVLCVLMCR